MPKSAVEYDIFRRTFPRETSCDRGGARKGLSHDGLMLPSQSRLLARARASLTTALWWVYVPMHTFVHSDSSLPGMLHSTTCVTVEYAVR